VTRTDIDSARSTAPGSRGSAFLSGGRALFASAEEKHIAAELDRGLERIETELFDELHFADDVADTVSRYLLNAGGKRVRPLLTMLTSQWGDGVTDDVVTSAQVIELTHLATLYHDDVMDEAVQRRGVTAAQKVWNNSVAILAGDLLFARAGSLGVGLGTEAMARQTEVFERLVLGQMRETVGPKDGEDPIAHYIDVLADKTGSLIALAGEFGITMSNAPREYVEPIREFGERIGIAFQLVDDVIDLAPSDKDSGKIPGTDIRRGVTTLPMLFLEQRAQHSENDAELLETLKGVSTGAVEANEVDTLIARLRDHEVTQATMDEARRVADEATEYLGGVPDGPVKDALVRFADQVVKRNT
jgi:heptaprenyl diphosphate synthase